MFFEMNNFVNFKNRKSNDARVINNYDFQVTRFACLFDSPSFGKQGIENKWYALCHGALYFLNLGMLSEAIFRQEPDAEIIAADTGDDHRGFGILPLQSHKDAAQVRETFLHAPKKPPINPVPVQPGNRLLLEALAPEAKKLGVQFVYVVTPTLGSFKNRPEYPPSMAGPTGEVPIINLACPDRYPELFQPELWHDPGHVNEKGARVFTHIVATELADWYSHHPPAGENNSEAGPHAFR